MDIGGLKVARVVPDAAEHAFVSVHPSKPGGRVLLLSDGLERLLHKPGYSFADLFERAFDDPDALIAELRDFEDQQGGRWFVPHDDATLLALRFPASSP